MKKMIMLTLAVLILVAPCMALAGNTEVDGLKDKFYKVSATLPDTTTLRPTGNGSPWVWPAPAVYTTGLPPASTAIPAGGYLILGMENIRVPANMKFLTVNLTYTGGGPLQFFAANFGSKDGLLSGGEVSSQSPAGSPYQLIYKIRPQPDWEWVIIRNTGAQAATLSAVVWDSNCEYVPGLTGWGTLVLVLLIAGTAFWVIRRRRAVAAA